MIIISKYSTTVNYDIKTTLDSSGISKLQSELKAAQNELQRLSSMDLISNEKLAKAQTQIKALQTALNKSYNGKLGMVDTNKFISAFTQMNGSVRTLGKDLSNAGLAGQRAFSEVINTFGKVDTQMKSVSKTTDKIFNTLGNTIRWGVIASGFQEMMNSVHNAATYVKDLDTSLTNIMMVTDYSREQMNEYAKTANEVAKSLGSTTVAVTKGSQVFSQAGYDLPQATQLAELSIKLANASGQTSDTTSDQIVAYMNAYGMDKDMEALSQALDSWAEVANVSAADVKELATASQKAASTANTVGVNMDQLAAQIATIESVTKDAPENIGNGLDFRA